MAIHTYEFYVERDVSEEETVELTLQAELYIEPFVRGKYSGPPENCYPDEGGTAEIEGPVLVQNEEGKFVPWDGQLTKDEISDVETKGYEDWVQAQEDSVDYDDYDDYDDYRDYDNFHDGRALAGGGKVFY